jgi:hypothetical protein
MKYLGKYLIVYDQRIIKTDQMTKQDFRPKKANERSMIKGR